MDKNVSILSRLRQSNSLFAPMGRKPASMQGIESRTLARQTENRERNGQKVPPKTGSATDGRSRGKYAELRQHWRSGQKKSQPIRVGILNIGGGGGNRTRVRKPSTESSTYLALLFGIHDHSANVHAL